MGAWFGSILRAAVEMSTFCKPRKWFTFNLRFYPRAGGRAVESGAMTKRERQIVLTTLGAVVAALTLVGSVDLLINGRIDPALKVLYFIIGLAVLPFVVPQWLEELTSHRPAKRGDKNEPPAATP